MKRIKPLYEQTKLICAYEPHTVPGFLQRPGYTRAVIEDVSRFHGLTDDIDNAVEGRLNRLRILESGKCMFSLVIEAGTLYAQRGSVAVMLDQLDYVERAASFANVALGIIPLGRLRTIWPGEGFYVYDESLVRSEHWTGGYRTKRPSEIETYLRIFKRPSDRPLRPREGRPFRSARTERLALPASPSWWDPFNLGCANAWSCGWRPVLGLATCAA